MIDFLTHLFDTAGFPPRWECGSWTDSHGWLHILSDLAIWSAYFAIPCILAYFVLRRRDVPFPAIFWLFGAFILACGTTHLMEAVIFWHPVYRLAGVIKLLTAIVSWGTVVALVPTVPKALALRSADELERQITARKKAEDAMHRTNAELETRVQERTAELAEAEERIRGVVNNVIDGIITIDEQGVVQSVNPAAERLFAYRSEEMVGQNVNMLMPEPYRGEHDAYVANYLHTGHAKIIGIGREVEGRRKDGSTFPMDLAVSEFRLGAHRFFTGIVRDITGRKRAEEAVKAAKEQLQIVTDSMSAHVSRCSSDLKYLWVSQPYADWLERSPNEIIGSPIIDIIGQKAFEQLRPYFEQVLSGQVVRYEERVHFQGIGPRWINVVYTPTFPEPRTSVSGPPQPDGWVAVVIDVDDRKRMEEAIRASEEQLSAELEAMTRLHALSGRLLACADLRMALDDVLENAILTSRADFGNIQLFNPEIKALEIVAKRGFQQDFLDYFRTVRVDEGSACAQAMQSGERIIIEDVQLDPTYERHRPIAAAAGYRAVQSTPLKSRSGGIVGMMSTHFRQPQRVSERDQRLLDLYARHAADFIERLRFEEALRDQEEALKEADRRKDEFLATLAHELRNPLAPICNAVELLRRADGDPALMEQVRSMMERQLAQMVRLIDDLLDISRITRGKLQLRKERIALEAVFQSAVEASGLLIDAKAHELTVTLPQEPIHLDADPARLAQVVSNLLSNAANYTEKGGRIRLTAEVASRVASAPGVPREVVVSVRDTGIGIAAEHLPRIFEMFSQVQPALERSQGGLGIGLALVRGLVGLHGGKVEARSGGIGMGSEFTVRLPIAETPAPRHDTPSRRESLGSVPPCRILVVDDNRDAAETLMMVLQLMGHKTDTAYDGLEAVQAAATFRPDVVLLDIGLPKMNGYESARHIRAQPWGKEMALIALTGWGQEEDKRRAFEAGFDHHLTKPVEAAALEKLLALIGPVPQHLRDAPSPKGSF
jgi:PAS domain S-box-containing protein